MYAQDDNASGHGISRNKKTGELVKNAERLELEAELVARGIILFTQAAQSPEQNRNDLGVLNMVSRRSRRHWREIREAEGVEAKSWALFQTIQKTFWDDELVPAYKMFNISQVKTKLLQRTVELKGKHAQREPHFGIRKGFGTWGH